jgi:hypothetical protein
MERRQSNPWKSNGAMLVTGNSSFWFPRSFGQTFNGSRKGTKESSCLELQRILDQFNTPIPLPFNHLPIFAPQVTNNSAPTGTSAPDTSTEGSTSTQQEAPEFVVFNITERRKIRGEWRWHVQWGNAEGDWSWETRDAFVDESTNTVNNLWKQYEEHHPYKPNNGNKTNSQREAEQEPRQENKRKPTVEKDKERTKKKTQQKGKGKEQPKKKQQEKGKEPPKKKQKGKGKEQPKKKQK